jgi:predicted DNA binding CopG/RHH family protein
MGKKRSGSSARAAHRGKNARHIPDGDIDFSDIPELTDEQLATARRVGRPRSDNPKKLIAIRLSPKLLANIQRMAARKRKPYQTLMQELLEKAMKVA